ncbi:hypothetical protein R3P38DRAFT_2784890 [Favolaschia claudopus]|uniref:Ribosomal protein L5 n=1 Tax=Favolaschia claudopus TaxID=2862362 RepID=A0AAW0AY55_9AGAR
MAISIEGTCQVKVSSRWNHVKYSPRVLVCGRVQNEFRSGDIPNYIPSLCTGRVLEGQSTPLFGVFSSIFALSSHVGLLGHSIGSLYFNSIPKTLPVRTQTFNFLTPSFTNLTLRGRNHLRPFDFKVNSRLNAAEIMQGRIERRQSARVFQLASSIPQVRYNAVLNQICELNLNSGANLFPFVAPTLTRPYPTQLRSNQDIDLGIDRTIEEYLY